MTPSETSVALELERLRGTIGTGLSDIRGDLKVINERTSRYEQDLAGMTKRAAEVEAAWARRVAELEGTHGSRISGLEKRVWIACGAGGAFGAVGGFLAALYGG